MLPVSLKCLSGLTIQCSNINTRFFVCVCLCAYCVFWAFRHVSRLLEFTNVCSKLEAITECVPHSFFLKLVLTCVISNFRSDKMLRALF